MKTLETNIVLPAWADPPPSPSWKASSLLRLPGQCLALVEIEFLKLRRDPTDLLTRAVQPALWLLIFGNVFSKLRAVPTGDLSYLDFMAPGILAQSVLFLAIFYGIGVIWERDLGIMHKLLVSPTPRVALVLGKALSAGLRALVQALFIYVLSWLLGVHLNWNPLALLGIGIIVLLGATAFSIFSLIIACLVKSRERFMGIGQVMTMPLFFASNAIYPIAIMPPWLKIAARLNPLSYQVDALRALMIKGGESHFGLGLDLIVLIGTTTLLTALCARVYPNLAQ
jgi:ABC-2 type transport system permease protein